jgi:hypothetical protein
MPAFVAGAFRLGNRSGIWEAMLANPRYAAVPLSVVVHIVSATLLATLGQPQPGLVLRRAVL